MYRCSFVVSSVLLAASVWCGACASTGQDSKTTAAPPAHAAQPMAAAQADAKDFQIAGHYAEACSCRPPCPCELTGPIMTCKGIGAYQFDQGSYGGQDFSGTRLAYSLYIGEEVQLYIDAPDAHKRAALEAFARAALAPFGPIKGVHDAKVELSGKDGAYTIKVDGGRIMTCTTEPMLGGDHKTPVSHHNTHDLLNPIMYQAVCTSCTYADGAMKIELQKGSNSYFNAHMQASGKV
jgi:hypothetical protein